MGYYVIIRGPLAVGKSTISRKLTKALKAYYISVDGRLSEYCFDDVSEDEECIPANNFIRATEMIMPDVIKKLDEGKIVIFDGCFYHKEQIDQLLRSLPEPHYAFNLRAKLRTCIERDGGRERAYGADAAVAVHNLVSRFDYGINIDTDDKTEGQVVEEILSHLPARSVANVP